MSKLRNILRLRYLFLIVSAFFIFTSTAMASHTAVVTVDDTIDAGAAAGDRCIADGAGKSVEIGYTVGGAADNVAIVTVTPPAGYTITAWSLDNGGGDTAVDTPNIDGNGAATTGGSGSATVCSSGCDATSLALALGAAEASGSTQYVGLTVTVPSTPAVSSAWAFSTTDDNGAPETDTATFKVAAATEDDICFDYYANGQNQRQVYDTSDSSVDVATGSAYLFGFSSANVTDSDYSNNKITLDNGLAVFVQGTNFAATADQAGTAFDYAIVEAADKATVDQANDYDLAGGSNHFTGVVAADAADPTFSSVTVNKSGGKNIVTLVADEPIIYDTLVLDADLSMASTSTIGDLSSITGLVFAGIGKWTDTDGQPNTTNATGSNTVAIDTTYTTITFTANSATNSYFSNTATSVASADGNDLFTPSTGIIKDAAGNDIDTTGVNMTFTAAWDVTSPATPSSLEKFGTTITADSFQWTAITDPGDFQQYLLLYSTSTISTASGASLWSSSNDSNLSTVTTSSTSISGLSEGTNYYYKLVGVDTYGNMSGLSNEVYSTFGGGGGTVGSGDITGPAAPTSFSGSIDDNYDATLTWTDPTDSDYAYVRVEKSTDEINYFWIASVDPGVETYTDDQLTVGQTVNYRLVAVDDNSNYGNPSNSIQLTVEVGSTAAAEDTTTDETTTDETTTDETTTDETTTDETTTDEATAENTADETAVELTDISGHWGEVEIMAMVGLNIVMGNPDGSFLPDNNLNRAEAAALISRILGITDPAMPDEMPYSDVEVDAWYAGYVNELMLVDIVSGNPDGTYQPGENINRAEFLTLALNAYYYLADEDTKAAIDALKDGEATDMFEDLDAEAWYAGTVTAAADMEFVSGVDCDGGKCFQADRSISRAEAVKILYNMFYDMLSA